MLRECGSCSECCTILAVQFPNYMKPHDSKCEYVRLEGGCSIYNKRPEVCRGYQCGWLELDALPNSCRPDLLGVMFRFEVNEKSWNPFEKTYVIANTNRHPDAFYGELAQACYQMFWNGGTPVWLQLNGGKILVNEYGQEISPDQFLEYEKKLRK